MSSTLPSKEILFAIEARVLLVAAFIVYSPFAYCYLMITQPSLIHYNTKLHSNPTSGSACNVAALLTIALT